MLGKFQYFNIAKLFHKK